MQSEGDMGLSAGANSNTQNRKRPVIIISAAIAGVVILGGVVAGAAALNSEPATQHVQFEITPRSP
jgi:hypothetical protein